MKIQGSLLEELSWYGAFNPPGRSELTFGAKVSYSPFDGIRFRYSIPMGAKFENSYDRLHGAVEDGIPCTLVGNFQLSNSGFSFKHGYSYHTHDKYPFHYIVFGGHFDSDLKVFRFGFDLTGVQEFFAPASTKKYTPFVQGNIYEANVGGITLGVHHVGTASPVPSNLAAIIHSPNKAAVAELQAAYEQVKARHQDFYPLLKQEFRYTFSVRSRKGLSVRECLEFAQDYANLFALLSCNPTRVSQLKILLQDKSGHWHEMPVFFADPVEKDVLDRSLVVGDYHQLPLTVSHISLPKVLKAWKKKSKDFSTPLSAIQSSGKFVSYHDMISSVVVSATQLEAISYDLGKKKDRFGYSVRLLASKKAKQQLRFLLKCTDSNLGHGISELRNEIAHAGRPRMHLARLTTRDLYKVSRILESTVHVYALRKLGITKQSVHHFQDTVLR